MALELTLGDLREYAAEVAGPDVSGPTGDREIQGWINHAIQRIHRSHGWNHFLASDRITMIPEEGGDNMALTLGSRDISLSAGETFDQKYLDEQWSLHVSVEGRMTFLLDEILSPTTARLKEGHDWTQDTQAATTYAWSRDRYPLPNDAKEILRVEYMQTRLDLRRLMPHEFDLQRQSTPTQRGNDPLFYTIRAGKIEIWPGPGTSFKTIQFSYRRRATVYKVTDPNTTVFDWVPEWDDLLHKAIDVEAARTQGQNAPIPYPLAKAEYMECLKLYKAEDTKVAELAGPMSLGGYRFTPDYTRITDYPASIPEVP